MHEMRARIFLLTICGLFVAATSVNAATPRDRAASRNGGVHQQVATEFPSESSNQADYATSPLVPGIDAPASADILKSCPTAQFPCGTDTVCHTTDNSCHAALYAFCCEYVDGDGAQHCKAC